MMYWKKVIAAFFGICFVLFSYGNCIAAGYHDETAKTKEKQININDVINKQLDSLDFSKIESTYKSFGGNNLLKEINFADGVKTLASGNAKMKADFISNIKTELYDSFLGEIKKNGVIFSKLLLLIVLLAILKTLQEYYKGDSSEIAFYACYILTVVLIMQSFKTVYTIGVDSITDMVDFMLAIFPMTAAMIGASGMPTAASVLSPTVITTVSVLQIVMKDIILPAVFFYTILEIINNISLKVKISNLCSLIKKICEWSMGILFTIFVAVMSIQGVASSSFDGVLGKTGKFALGNFVPVIGGMLSDALDSVLSCTLLIKNSVSILGIIILIAIICIPLVKLACIILMYKLSSAISQPIADERIVSVLNKIGGAVSLIFISVLSSGFVFIVSLAIIISISSPGLGKI